MEAVRAIKNVRIDELGLSNGAWNSLKRTGINTVGDIADRWRELGEARGIGEKRLDEIKKKVAPYIIAIKSEDTGVIPVAVIKRKIAAINAMNQCDQASVSDLIFRNSLDAVLKWYETPDYKEVEEKCEYTK